MTSIVTPQLDLENWTADRDTGPHVMFSALQRVQGTDAWVNRNESVRQLVEWWARVPSYDPDIEPEWLIHRNDLTDFSKEILGQAAARRCRPRGLSWEIPNEKELNAWLESEPAKNLRAALTLETSPSWWSKCLFEGSIDDRFHARTEHLVRHLMHDHPFVHMSSSLSLPLAQLLPMMTTQPNSPSAECTTLPDLC